ncbi:MAG: flavodoxin family protein [Planctomycetaceae bacterium]
MKPKEILIFMGSPRRKGNSSILAAQVAAGAEAAGAEVESFFLHGMNIHPCDACEACRDKTETDCILDDDMKDIFPKLRRADGIVISSPIYWFTVSAQTKLFMDRWYALGGPEGYALKGKKFGIVLTYADIDPFTSGAVNALRTFQDALNFIDATIVGTVYRSAWEAGKIKANRELMEKAYDLGKKMASDAG